MRRALLALSATAAALTFTAQASALRLDTWKIGAGEATVTESVYLYVAGSEADPTSLEIAGWNHAPTSLRIPGIEGGSKIICSPVTGWYVQSVAAGVWNVSDENQHCSMPDGFG